MNYCVSIGERQYRVNVQNNRLMIDGEPAQGHLIPLNTSGLHLLRRGQRDVELYLQAQDAETVEVLVGAQRVIARLETPNRPQRKKVEPAQPGALNAPMPGLVTTVQVCAGDCIEKGQVLVVLESMKMQMQLRAPLAGRVTQVPAVAGTQVEKGALLVQIELISPEEAE